MFEEAKSAPSKLIWNRSLERASIPSLTVGVPCLIGWLHCDRFHHIRSSEGPLRLAYARLL
jgi:hypothetical protein